MARRTTPKPGRSNGYGQVALRNTPTLNGLPNVQYVRNELVKMLSKYRRIADCIEGSDAVKMRGDEYLPRPNSADDSEENRARYDAYKARAVFYAVTFRTVRALVGQIFLRDAKIELPTSFDTIQLDATGTNVSLKQLAERTAKHALAFGRAGLHVDYTTAPNGVSLSQKNKGDYRPTITEYEARSVINWRKAQRGSRMVYTLVVIEDEYTAGDDGFESRVGKQYLVLRLVPANNAQAYLLQTNTPEDYGDLYDAAVTSAVSDASDVYVMEVWRSDDSTIGGTYSLAQTYYPKGDDGKFLNEIPFIFVGSEENDDTIDQPPVEALAEVNLAHYRNSADYEESVFLIGQPTPYVSGVTQEWNENVLKGTIQLGSRGVIVLPNGGTAGLLQAQPNTLAKEAMDQKERQMVALGAKLVEQREVQRTATEAEMESTADTSILAKIADNVSAGIEWALKKCCVFTGEDDSSISYVLNKEFDLTRMPADSRQQLLLEYEADMITTEEMRANLRRGGIATLDDKTFATEIEKQKAEKQSAAIELAQASKIQTKAVIPGSAPPPGSTGNSPGNTAPANKRTGTKPNSKPSPQPAGT